MFTKHYEENKQKINRIRQKSDLGFSDKLKLFFISIGQGINYIFLHLLQHPTSSFQVLAKRKEDGTWELSYDRHLSFVKRLKQLVFSGAVFIVVVIATTLVLHFLFPLSPITKAASYSWIVPDTYDWTEGTLSNTQKSGTDLVLTNKTLQWVQTNWSGGSGQLAWTDTTKYYSSSYTVNAGTELKLQSGVAQNFTLANSKLNTSNSINDVTENTDYVFFATASGLDVINKSDNSSLGYISLTGGFNSVDVEGNYVYFGRNYDNCDEDADNCGVFKQLISSILGNTAAGSPTYTTTSTPALPTNKVLDIDTATISSKVYLAVGGESSQVAVIKDEQSSPSLIKSSDSNSMSFVVITNNDYLYYGESANMKVVFSISGKSDNFGSDEGQYPVLGGINHLYVSEGTSTAQAGRNTLYVSESDGMTIIQESDTSVGYYYNILEGSAGSSNRSSANFYGAFSFSSTNEFAKANDADSLDIAGNLSMEAFIRPGATITSGNASGKNLGLIDKGDYKLYIEGETGNLVFELNSAAATSFTKITDANFDGYTDVLDTIVYKNNLYAGTGTADGGGDIWYYDGSNWAQSYDGTGASFRSVNTFEIFGGKLYAGVSGASDGDGNVLVCDPTATGGSTVCDSGDWSVPFDGAEAGISALGLCSGKLMVGEQGAAAGQGDIVSFNGSTWSASYDGTQEAILDIKYVYNNTDSVLCYAGQGIGAGDGDILRYDGSSWSTAYDSDSNRFISGIAIFNGKIYAALNISDSGDPNVAGMISCNSADSPCSSTGQWSNDWQSLGFTNNYERAYDLEAYNGNLYVSLGTDAGDADVAISSGNGSWSLINDGSESAAKSLNAGNGKLYYSTTGSAGDGDIYMYGNNEFLRASSPSSWTANTWYHVAATYDGSEMEIFVNGVSQGTKVTSITPETGTSPLYIGTLQQGEYSNVINGLVDEVRVTDTAVYSSNFTPPSSQLSFPGGATKGGLWHANGAGATAADSSGLSNNATLYYRFGGQPWVSKYRQPVLSGSEDNITSSFANNSGSIVWYAVDGTAADDGYLGQLNGISSNAPYLANSWTTASSPALVDNDGTAVSGTTSGTAADLEIGTSSGATRLIPGVALSGNLVSSVYNFGTANLEFGTITWSETLNGETISVKARSDSNADMSGATAWASCDALVKDSDLTANNCVDDGEQYLQYRVEPSTDDSAQNPQLEDITLNVSRISGTYTKDFDASATAGWVTLEWTATKPSNTDVKFRFKTSANGSTWSDWSSYFTSSPGDLTSLAASRYLRTEAYLETTANSVTPTIDTFTITRSQNGPPSVQNVVASQTSSGIVNIVYEVKDADTLSGSVNPGFVDVSFQYYNGSSWEDCATTTGEESKAVSESQYTGYSGTWTAATDFTDQYFADTVKIRVTVNDNELLYNTASSDSAAFVLDTKDPTAGATPISINAAAAKTNDLAVTLTLSASDDSSLTMTFSNDNSTFGTVTNDDGVITNSGSYETYSASKAWTLLAGDDGTRTTYVKFKDAKGNETGSYSDAITYDLHANDIISNLDIDDASDIGIGRFRLVLNWNPIVAANNLDFDHYLVEMSTDGTAYSTEATFSDVTEDNYIDKNLTQGQHYYYRVKSVDNANNASSSSTVVSDVPGDDDTTPPDLSGEAPVSVCATSVCTVGWTTDESADSCVQYGATADYGNIECELDFVTSHEIEISGLTSGTDYHYRVISRDATGNQATGSDYTMATRESTDDVTPPQVSADGPIVSPADDTAVIAWRTDEEADSYVEFGLTTEYDYLQGSEDLTTDHAITLIGLESQKTYNFRIKSTDAAGNTAVSDNDTFTTTLPADADEPPTISSIETQAPGVSTTSITITWMTDTYSTSQILYGTTSELGSKSEEDTVLTKKHYVSLADLTPGTTYYYQVRSEDTYGNVTVSDLDTFTTATEETVAETEISNITAQTPGTSATSVTIVWMTNVDTTSQVLYGTTSDLGLKTAEDATFTKKHFFTITGLTPNTKYYYQVSSKDADGNITTSGIKTFITTQLLTGSPQISGVKVSDIALDSAIISWQSFKIATSDIQYGAATDYGSSIIDESASLTTQHVVRLADLTSGTAYHFRIYSQDADANQIASDDYVFNTLAMPVMSVVEITEVQDKQAVITWNTNVDTDSVIEYGPDTNYGFSQGLSDYLTAHKLTLIGLEPSTLYYFRIKGRDIYGNLGQSGDYTLRTKIDSNPPKITDVKFEASTVAVGQEGVNILVSWNTDEPASSQVLYHQGLIAPTDSDAYELKTKEDINYNMSHMVVLPRVKSSVTYHFRVKSIDQFNNQSLSDDYAIVTPPKTRSILANIIASLEARFVWLAKLKDLFSF